MRTKSEGVFEDFLTSNGLPFQRIEESTTPRPDYLVSTGGTRLIFELKELTRDANFGVIDDPINPHIKSFSGTIGEHVRRRITGSKKQIQYGAKQGIPSVLLLYNDLDRVFQMFGTTDMNFVAAMYSEYTITIGKGTRKASESFNGKNQSLQQDKNTSFSAVGRLCDLGGKITATLFENAFAQVKVHYEQLPPCFDVRRG